MTKQKPLLVLFLSGSLLPCCRQTPPDFRPNFIFIMSDDHAEQAISAYGSTLIETPNIDRIAEEGIRFNNSFVTNSICAPSRAVLLTGQYSHLNGLRDNRDRFDGSQMTFPKLLQNAGYQTGAVGKWHLKTDPTGFDDWKILIGQGEYYNPTFNENGEEVQYTGYVTDLITDFAIEFLDSRDPDKPFFLLYNHKAPHRNWMPALEHLDRYSDRDLPVPDTFHDDYQGRKAAGKQDMRVADMWLSSDMKLHKEYYGEETGTGGNDEYNPEQDWETTYNRLTEEQKSAWDAHYRPINEAFRDNPPVGKALAEWKYQRYIKDYLRCVTSVDDNLGRVLNYLDNHGLAENTIVIYTSDQGFYLGEHGWYDKRFMYEESLSMPLVMRYPAEVSGLQVSGSMVLNLDFAPTILDYAGVEIPSEMQGKSFRPLARGDGVSNWRDAMYYHYYEYPHGWHKVKRHYGIRTERYKLIHFYEDVDVWELYDLAEDPHELENLYGRPSYEQVQQEMHERLEVLQLELKDEVVSRRATEGEP